MLVTIDTGGTKTLVTSFTKTGEMGEVFRFPTPKEPSAYITALRTILKEKYSHEQVDAIIIGIPGTIKNGVAIWCNNLEWSNFHISEALEGVLGTVPIFIENDANLAGLAEDRSLEEKVGCSLYVTISTGIGTGIITESHINEDLRLSEGGRILVEYNGHLQEWEKFASGKAIYTLYGTYARDITSKRTWNKIADRISRGFLTIIPLLQPDVIIIGGSIGTYFDRYGKQLSSLLERHLPPHIPTPPIRSAQHPEQAVIYGCYFYGIDQLSNR